MSAIRLVQVEQELTFRVRHNTNIPFVGQAFSSFSRLIPHAAKQHVNCSHPQAVYLEGNCASPDSVNKDSSGEDEEERPVQAKSSLTSEDANTFMKLFASFQAAAASLQPLSMPMPMSMNMQMPMPMQMPISMPMSMHMPLGQSPLFPFGNVNLGGSDFFNTSPQPDSQTRICSPTNVSRFCLPSSSSTFFLSVLYLALFLCLSSC